MPLLPGKLNTRIILVVSCTLFATGITSGWITARNQTAALLGAMREERSLMVKNFTHSCARYLLVQDYAELESFLQKAAALPDIQRLQICDAEGALVWDVQRQASGQISSKTGLARLSPPSSRSMLVSLAEQTLVIWHPVEAGNLLGWIKAEFSLATIRKAQAQTWKDTLLLTMLWVVCSGGLVILVLRPIVDSIRRLTCFASELVERKGAQLEPRRSQPVELIQLGDSLNQASTKLLLTEQELTTERERLRESEEMYRSLVTSMAEGVVFQRADGTITAANPAAEQLLGWSADQIVGHNSLDPQWQAVYENGEPFPGDLHPPMVALRTGEAQSEVVMGIHRADGNLVWISVNTQPLFSDQGRPYAAVSTFHDITQRKQADDVMQRLNRELRALSNCNQALVRAEDEQTLLAEICSIICNEAGYCMAWVGYAQDDEAKSIVPVAWAGAEDGYLGQVRLSWADDVHDGAPSGMAIRHGESACTQDFLTGGLESPWRQAALDRGYRSGIALPLKEENGTTFGVLSIYSEKPNALTRDEKRLLEELSGDLAFGIITLRHRAERLRAEAALRQSEGKLREAQHIGHFGYWDRDFDAGRITLSDESCRILGVPPQEQSLDLNEWQERWLMLIHADDRAKVMRAYNDALSGGPRYDVEYRLVRSGGEMRIIHSHAEVTADETGRARRMVGTMQDVTEVKQAVELLNRLNEELESRVQQRTSELEDSQQALMNLVEDLNLKTAELEQANSRLLDLDRLKSMFIASMSHELRTPLNSIIGFSSIIRDGWIGAVNAEQKENLDIIQRAGKHLLTLINDVIDVSKIEAGKIDVRIESFDLYDLLNEAIQYVEKDIREKGLELSVQITHVQLRTDRRRLLQCVLNLLSNAAKFTEKGRIVVSAVTKPSKEKGRIVIIEVADTGIGIADKDLTQVFKPFVRLDTHLKPVVPGTGLGLYLTRKLVRGVLEGEIECRSELGKGSTFSMKIPAGLIGNHDGGNGADNGKGTGSRG